MVADTPAGDEPAPVTSYKVRYRQVGTSPWQNVTRANDDRSATQEINNLTNRNHYEVQVAAVNRVGTGQWASVKATPAGTGFPATSSDWRCSAHPGHPRTVLG